MAISIRRKKIKIFFYIFLVALILFAIYVCLNIPFAKLVDYFNNSYATLSEINTLKESNYFGPFISVEVNDYAKTVSATENNDTENIIPEIKFKLFNLIPIKTQKIKLIKDDKVILGGNAVGIVLKMKGVRRCRDRK